MKGKRMIIVLEGVDNSGKSTLAKFLAQALHMPLQSSEGPPKYDGEMDERLERYMKLRHVIFDRHPVISQPIYRMLRENTPAGAVIKEKWVLALYSLKPVLVYCDPGHRGLEAHRRNVVDTEQHLQQLDENYAMLLSMYRSWAFQHADFIYRIGDDRNLLLSRILAFNPLRDIVAFHEKFQLNYNGPPRFLPDDLDAFRASTLYEELYEYENADKLDERFDALIDLMYFALGTAYLHGFPFEEGWRRVHEANMRKVRAQRPEDSKRNSTHDVVKPPGWQAPTLVDLLER